MREHRLDGGNAGGAVRVGGDPLFARIVSRGGADDLETALTELGQVGQPL